MGLHLRDLGAARDRPGERGRLEFDAVIESCLWVCDDEIVLRVDDRSERRVFLRSVGCSFVEWASPADQLADWPSGRGAQWAFRSA